MGEKIYYTNLRYKELAAFLLANGRPFEFNGEQIYFRADEEFIRDMKQADEVISHINFKIEQ